MTLATNGLQNAVAYRFVYADAAARTAATGFVAGDVGSLALQQDTNVLYLLTATTPTWQATTGVSAHASTHQVGGSDAFTGVVPGSAFAPGGLTGATSATRYVGGTASAAPTTGTFAVGDFVITLAGSIYICTTAGTPGTWTAVSGGGGGGAWTLVSETILASAAASITFSSIPQTGKHLVLYVVGRTAGAVQAEELGLRANGDSATNYNASGLYSNNTSPLAVDYTGQASAYAGVLPGASASPSTLAGFATITAYDYARATTFSKLFHTSAGRWDGASRSVNAVMAFWNSTAAITSLTLVGRSGNNLVAGTRAALYIIS